MREEHTVACIQADSGDRTAEDPENAGIPPAGKALFYLVVFNEGGDSGAGSAAAKPPTASE